MTSGGSSSDAARSGGAAALPLGDALDALAVPMLLVDAQLVLHAWNAAAMTALRSGGGLQVRDGRLRARRGVGAGADLKGAIQAALADGQRRMVALGGTLQVAAVAPLADAPARVLVLLSAPPEPSLFHEFAALHGLTRAETRVLDALWSCTGAELIAARLGIGADTVHDHLAAIRRKTGAPDTHALLRRLALLPPLRIGARVR
jgi:DNA-binding CsgD family transcriptional regulator